MQNIERNISDNPDPAAQPAAASAEPEPSPSPSAAQEGQEDEADAQWTVVPENAESIHDDGAIKKIIIKEGDGDVPTLHARCLVQYVGRLLSTGEVFMDTAQEYESGQPAQLVAGRDCVFREAGLNIAVATMKVGEVARIYVLDPQYGYGERGSFSFPCVPPDSRLVYEMELLNFEPIPEGEGQKLVTYEDRIDACERRRLAGNQLFQEGKHREALNKYAMALSFIDEDFMMQLGDWHLDKAEAVKAPLHLNMAACQLRLGDPTTAVYNCGQVLALQPKNVKAMYRRGVARHQLGQTEEALQDLEAALKLDPNNVGIQKEIRAVKQTIKAERAAEKAMFKGTLGPAPAPVEAPVSSSLPAGGCAPEAAAADGQGPAAVGGGRGVVRQEARAGLLQSLVQMFAFLLGALQELLAWMFGVRRKA